MTRVPVVMVTPAGKLSVGPPVWDIVRVSSSLPSRGPSPPTLQRLLRAVEQFLHVEAASSVLLLIATVAALVWANTAESSYTAFWHTALSHGPGLQLLTRPLLFWVNDGLMTFFFLLVGLEIRAETHGGVLAQPRQAMLPIAAALGGIMVPVALFLGLNSDPLLRRGWAVPMATDIAFSLGALALLGKRVPPSLRVLLLTLAIVDDIAAVLVIAMVYSGGIAVAGLVIAGCGAMSVFGLRLLGVRQVLAYAICGSIIWIGLLRAGIHPTLTGVVLGIMAPVSNRQKHDGTAPPRDVGLPHTHLEDVLHVWVAFAIMPLFALANAGVCVQHLSESAAQFPSLAGGVVLGLVIGKPVGILLAALLCVKLGFGALPAEVRWPHMVVLGCVAGVGFTMSIFLADLAFAPGDLLVTSKSAILLASLLAAIIGLVSGRCTLPNPAGATRTDPQRG
jgi:Na+:H+ antiporter, NhaA family